MKNENTESTENDKKKSHDLRASQGSPLQLSMQLRRY